MKKGTLSNKIRNTEYVDASSFRIALNYFSLDFNEKEMVDEFIKGKKEYKGVKQ